MLRLASRSLSLAALAVLALAVPAAGCGLLRSPPSPAERLAATARRLGEAPTDSARAAVAVALFREAGLTPLAGDRFEYGRSGTGASRVVAGFVPGRAPGARDTLVVVAASIDGADAAVLVEAARGLVYAADRVGADPGRSVLVALWSPDAGQAQGLLDVLAFPLWPRGAVRRVLVVGDAPTGVGVVSTFGVPAEAVSSGPESDGRLSPERLVARVLASAAVAYGSPVDPGVPSDPGSPADSVQTSPLRN